MIRFELVGMKFRGNLAVEAVNALKEGDKISLQREPTNKYDENAIKVLLGASKVFVAYVRRTEAALLSNLLWQEEQRKTAQDEVVDPTKFTHIATICEIHETTTGNLVFAEYTFN